MVWTKEDPTNDGLLINAPGQIRANWDALELMTDSDLLITNAKCAAGMGLVDSKLAQITTPGKISGAAITSINLIPSGAGTLPLSNIPSTLTGKDADTLDGEEGSYYRSATNINAGALKHEYGGIEADISAIAKGGLVVGTGAGTMGIKAAGTDGHFIKYNSSVAGGIEGAVVENLSNVIFKWTGHEDSSQNNEGLITGNSLVPTGVNGKYMFFQRISTAYRTVLRSKFKKIAGITTIAIHARLWNGDASNVNFCQVDIGGQTGTVSNTGVILPAWATADTVDVSSLSDGTTYDLLVKMKRTSGSSVPSYMSSVILIAS